MHIEGTIQKPEQGSGLISSSIAVKTFGHPL